MVDRSLVASHKPVSVIIARANLHQLFSGVKHTAMQISVIISTYNSPDWLEKTLWGYFVQSYKKFEVIIADDGSTSETRQLIDCISEQSDFTIKHVWQKDEGFRKCRILNKAILETESEYLVFTD